MLEGGRLQRRGLARGASEALAVDNGRAGLVVLLLRDPHLLEGAQRSEDGAADPDRVLALRRRHHADADAGRREGGDLLLDSVREARKHGGAAGEDDVGEEVAAHVDVAPHDGVEGGLMDAARLEAEEGGLEQDLRAAEALVADGDDLRAGRRR